MFRSVVDRAWHLAVTVGPIVVIALALVGRSPLVIPAAEGPCERSRYRDH